jgi:hypothetical protein
MGVPPALRALLVCLPQIQLCVPLSLSEFLRRLRERLCITSMYMPYSPPPLIGQMPPPSSPPPPRLSRSPAAPLSLLPRLPNIATYMYTSIHTITTMTL